MSDVNETQLQQGIGSILLAYCIIITQIIFFIVFIVWCIDEASKND